jgi:hypothetical protein
MSTSNAKTIILNSLVEISKINPFQHKWLSDVLVAKLLASHAKIDPIPTEMKKNLTYTTLNKCFTKCKFSYIFDLNSANSLGIFKRVFRKKSANRYIHCFYF